jgi:hypothetical protein
MNSKYHALSALTPGADSPVPIKKETGLVPEFVCKMKFFTSPGIEIRFVGHSARSLVIIPTERSVYKWKPMLRRPLGRPKNRWADDIRNDIKN